MVVYFSLPGDDGRQTVTIGGIIANASALGDGEDVTAEVSVNGVMIKFSPIKLAGRDNRTRHYGNRGRGPAV